MAPYVHSVKKQPKLSRDDEVRHFSKMSARLEKMSLSGLTYDEIHQDVSTADQHCNSECEDSELQRSSVNPLVSEAALLLSTMFQNLAIYGTDSLAARDASQMLPDGFMQEFGKKLVEGTATTHRCTIQQVKTSFVPLLIVFQTNLFLF